MCISLAYPAEGHHVAFVAHRPSASLAVCLQITEIASSSLFLEGCRFQLEDVTTFHRIKTLIFKKWPGHTKSVGHMCVDFDYD